MTIQQFITKRKGKRYAESAQYWYQCVAICKLLVKEVYGIQLVWFSWSARAGWNTWSPFNNKRTRIQNTPNWVPSEWDVIFFDILTLWHVAVVVSADKNTVKVIEQNRTWGGKWLWADAISVNDYNYSKVLWWYSLQKDTPPPQPPENLWWVPDLWNWLEPDRPLTRREMSIILERFHNKYIAK